MKPLTGLEKDFNKELSKYGLTGESIAKHMANVAMPWIEKAWGAGHDYGSVQNNAMIGVLHPELKKLPNKEKWLKENGIL